MSIDLLEDGPATMLAASLGLALLVGALGVWLLRDARRASVVLALAGLLVLGLAVVLGWVEAARDVERLRVALQERGVSISSQQARDVREALGDDGEYASTAGAARAWRLTVRGEEIVLDRG